MATASVALYDGDGAETGVAEVTYGGAGDGCAVFTSGQNEGLDREGEAVFAATSPSGGGSVAVTRAVRQMGMREKFTDDFTVADGGTLHVLKPGTGRNGYVCFENGGGGVTELSIDGATVTLEPGETYSGFIGEWTRTWPHYLRRFSVTGSVRPYPAYYGEEQDTLEEARVAFAPDYSVSCANMFYDCTALRKVSLSGGRPTSMSGLLYLCSAVTEVTLRDVDCTACESVESAFRCRALEELDLRGVRWGTLTACHAMFYSARSLRTLRAGELDFTQCADQIYDMWSEAPLTDVTGVIRYARSVTVDSRYLTRESAMVFIEGLSEDHEEGATLTLSSATKALLTDEDIAVATDKGWTIA